METYNKEGIGHSCSECESSLPPRYGVWYCALKNTNINEEEIMPVNCDDFNLQEESNE